MSDIKTEEFLADIDKAVKTVERLQQSNVSKVEALAKFGKGVDLAVLANLKIDTFVEMFLDDNARLIYMYNLETRLKEMLDSALSIARQEQLTTGVTQLPKLTLPR